MIDVKVRILTNDYHTFRPYIKSFNQLATYGIELVDSDAKDYDITMVGHSLFQDKKLGSFEASVQKGLDFLDKIEGPYILLDSQDSSSVIGAWETFIESRAICLLKDTLLKDRSLYKEGWVGGRWYWGKSEDWGIPDQNYIPKDWDIHEDKLFLSGKNWLGVEDYNFNIDWKSIDKLFDLSLMFQYPHPECHEFDLKPSQDFYYNAYRKRIFDKTKDSQYMIAKLNNGKRLDGQEWSKYQASSKVILSPFGYGAYGAPRDIAAVTLGSILLKEDLSYLDTYPNVYRPDETYIACKNDFSDLEEKIEYCVENFTALRSELVNNMITAYNQAYHPEYLAQYTHKLFKNIGVM